jgi:squalene-associated FAD-dependent desaturase
MSETPTVHVVGGGLAGLAAALGCAEAGARTVLHEAAPRLGGRCRSFHDATLGLVIDNGNHLMMGANHAALGLVARAGAMGELAIPARPAYPMVDLASGRRFTVRPGGAARPWWPFAGDGGAPGAGLADLADVVRLARAPEEATVAQAIRRRGALWRSFWEPLTVAAINAPPERAQARLLWPVIARAFLGPRKAARPVIARRALAAALVDPVAARLQALGGTIRLAARIDRLEVEDGRVRALDGGGGGTGADGRIRLGPRDALILAVPWHGAARLLPGLATPGDGAPILNAHFRLSAPPPPLPAGALLLGVLGATSQWIFVRGDHVAVTVSAADLEAAGPDEQARLARIGAELRAALALPETVRIEAGRIITEKRATFDPAPASVALRPQPGAANIANLLLAGDWTATGLPATIEGAVASGDRAAALMRQRLREL